MPCDTRYLAEQQKIEREKAIKELEALIAAGKATIVKNFKGQVSIVNWGQTSAAKAGWMEGCALARMASSSWIVKAKMQAMGVNPKQVVEAHGHGH